MIESTNALSSTVFVIGPIHSKDSQLLAPGFSGTRHPGNNGTLPNVGFIPYIPQKELGILIDPPPSLPIASDPILATTDAAAPPLDPPGVLSKFQGFRVVQKTELYVTPLYRNSGVFVFPMNMAPASRRRTTTTSSSLVT